jgi:phosphoribosyl 1,2-cyclic phosphate phosphodiesterase
MFSYAFEEAPGSPHSRPRLELHAVTSDPFMVGEAKIVPVPLWHGPMPVLGFRFGALAYCTDVSRIPPSSMKLLENLDVLVLDALRDRPHPAHYTLEQAVEVAGTIGARRTYFTHTTHELPYKQTNQRLPSGMAMAYDGLKIRLSVEGAKEVQDP